MKKLFKYAFMLMVIALGTVSFTSCGSDDDDSGSGSGSASNGTFVLDGKAYQIEIVDIDEDGNQIDFVCASKDAGMEIETMDKSVFPTTLQAVKCEVEAGTDEGGNYEADNIPVQCYVNGTKCKFVISNANIDGHTVSVTFDGDASNYTESKYK